MVQNFVKTVIHQPHLDLFYIIAPIQPCVNLGRIPPTVENGSGMVWYGGDRGVLLCMPVVVALLLCKPPVKNQVSNHMLTTSLFLLGILVGLVYADYLKRQLKK